GIFEGVPSAAAPFLRGQVPERLPPACGPPFPAPLVRLVQRLEPDFCELSVTAPRPVHLEVPPPFQHFLAPGAAAQLIRHRLPPLSLSLRSPSLSLRSLSLSLRSLSLSLRCAGRVRLCGTVSHLYAIRRLCSPAPPGRYIRLLSLRRGALHRCGLPAPSRWRVSGLGRAAGCRLR